MDNKPLSRYEILNKSLTEMREEYKLSPSKFLLKKIELVQTKLKQIDSIVNNFTTSGGGNYPPTKISS